MTVPESLRDPGLVPLWEAVARRLERSGADNRGRLRVPPLTRSASVSLAALIGRDVGVMVDLIAVESGLVRLGVAADLPAALALLGVPVSSEPAERRAARRQAAEARAEVKAVVGVWPEPWAAEWIDEVVKAGLIRNLTPVDATDLVGRVRRVLDALPVGDDADGTSPPRSRVELAAAVLGDAHALDTGTRLEAAVTRVLRRFVPERERRDLWEAAGAHLDLLSGPVLTWGLRLIGGGPLAAVTDAAADAALPVHLTQFALRRHPAVVAAGTPVLVAENPRVVEAAAQRGATGAVICTSGNPSGAGVLLLRQLLEAGAELRYHGDFDEPGLAICRRMAELGLTPWRMTSADYLAALASADDQGVTLPVEPTPCGPTPWDPDLRTVFDDHRRIVHEERVLDDLLGRP